MYSYFSFLQILGNCASFLSVEEAGMDAAYLNLI
jgi:hypothetical protein